MHQEVMILSSVVRGALIGLSTLVGALFTGWVFGLSPVIRHPPPPVICFLIALYGSMVSIRLCSALLGNVAFVAVFWSSLWLLDFIQNSARAGRFSVGYWFILVVFGLLHLAIQSLVYAVFHWARGEVRGTEGGTSDGSEVLADWPELSCLSASRVDSTACMSS